MEEAFLWSEAELRWKSLLAFSKQQQHKLIPLTLQSCYAHLKLMSETLEFILLKTTLFIMTFINIPLIVQHPEVPVLQKNERSRGLSQPLFFFPPSFFFFLWGTNRFASILWGHEVRVILVKHSLSLCQSLREHTLHIPFFISLKGSQV